MRVGILIQLKEDVYECISYAAKLGFRSGQLSVWDMSLYTKENAQIIKKACSDFDFTITAVWCGWTGPVDWSYPNMYMTLGLVPSAWRSHRVKELLDGAAFARELGVKDVVTHLGYLPDNPFHEDRIGAAHAVNYICKTIGKYGQRFLFETGEVLPYTLIQFMKEVGMENVGVNFDPANFLINGRANPTDAMSLLGSYVGGFHAKDGVYAEGTNPKGKEVMVGQGMVDFPALVEKLYALGYKGDISIEREIPHGEERDRQILEEKGYLEGLIERKIP